MTLNEYLENPCKKLSIPYWKNKKIFVPANMKIVHQDFFSDKYLDDYQDEKYFRLIHYLNDVNDIDSDNYFIKTAKKSDIPLIVEIINKSYSDLSVSHEQILSYMHTEVYEQNLWILVYDKMTSLAVGCGIADYDSEAKEGILEWIQVLPSFRGKGIGRLIVNNLLYRMKNADFATVSGKIDNITKPERLYRSCGFEGNDIWHILTVKN